MMEPDALIEHIQVRAGFSACFGWDTYRQYGWNWGWDIDHEDAVEGERVQRKEKSKEMEEEEVIFLREQFVPPKKDQNYRNRPQELYDSIEGKNSEQAQRNQKGKKGEEEIIFFRRMTGATQKGAKLQE